MAAKVKGVKGAPDPSLDPYDDQDMDDMGVDQNMDWERPKGRFPIVPLVLVVLFIGGLTAIFGFNVFNIRDGVIFPPLRNLPVVGNLIPGPDPAVTYVYVNGYMVPEVPVQEPQAPEIDANIVALMAELEATRAELNQALALNEQFEETVTALQTYRDLITDFNQQREQFDYMVAMGDPNAFASFYEEMFPENAAQLFAQIRATQQVDRQFRNYARTYAEMNTDAAAEVFAIMLNQNPLLLVQIIETFNTVQRADVFNEMEAADVARITHLMEPDAVAEDLLPPVPIFDGPTPLVPVIAAPDPVPMTALVEMAGGDEEDAEDSDEEAEL